MLLDGVVVWNGTTARVLMIPTLVVIGPPTLEEVEDDVVLKGTTPSLTPDCRGCVTELSV